MHRSTENKVVLVTGGAGYIGSHTCVELLDVGYVPVVFDNFSNSSPEVLARIESLTGRPLRFYQGDIRDPAALDHALMDSGASAVVHFAGLKAVGESVEQPLRYYDNNVVGTLRCRIPDDCIDSKRYPLFMARDVMRVLIEQLQAEGATPS